MDERMTPALYLELSPDDPEAYARERAEAVMAAAGASRGTWWRNQRPGRADLPRRLATPAGGDFPTLAVYERPDDTPVDLAPPDGGVALRFARYPRPAQGRLTGNPTRGIQLVLIHPTTPDQAQSLRDWGDFVHLRHIAEAACPGFTTITPYERAADERTDDGPRYLHLYEMDTAEPEPAFRAMTPLVASRLGGEDTERFKHWARHPALVIDYVNTFAYVDEMRSSTSPSAATERSSAPA